MAAAVREYRSEVQPVFVTGHSLGAALAGLAVAAASSERVEIAGLYTYGMPRVGNHTFAEKFMKNHGKKSVSHSQQQRHRHSFAAIGRRLQTRRHGQVPDRQRQARERRWPVEDLQETSEGSVRGASQGFPQARLGRPQGPRHQEVHRDSEQARHIVTTGQIYALLVFETCFCG